jgi:hypothetical protein
MNRELRTKNIVKMNNKKNQYLFKNLGKYTVTVNRILIKNRELIVTVASLFSKPKALKK